MVQGRLAVEARELVVGLPDQAAPLLQAARRHADGQRSLRQPRLTQDRDRPAGRRDRPIGRAVRLDLREEWVEARAEEAAVRPGPADRLAPAERARQVDVV